MSILHIIPILLTLGTSPDCDGYGVCILESQTEERSAECQKYENCISAEMDYADRELVLIVSQHKIKDKAFIKYFTKQYFELDKDFLISDELATALDCPQGTIIPQGKYPINEENGKIVVRMKTGNN